MSGPRVAIVHDWLTGMRGGEYVLEAIAEIFPKSDLFTLLYVPGKIAPAITTLKRHTSLLQKIPGSERYYRHYLPLMPWLIERLDLSGFDLVISSSHCVAKGIRKSPGAVHVSYVHAPMRYMWSRYEDYFGEQRASPWVRLAARSIRPRMQRWDKRVSQEDRVDQLIGNSKFIADQIHEYYGRTAKVVYPFVEASRFNRARAPGRNYLLVGAFAPNKRFDLAIEAFNRMKLPLLIMGGGQDEKQLKRMAGPTIEFLGKLSNEAIADLYSKCRAFLLPGIEDFGITPLEAMAAGAPVIAFGEGGALETVTKETGAFFRPQTVEALIEAVERIERGEKTFDEGACRARAAQFSKARFQREIAAIIEGAWVGAGKDPSGLRNLIQLGWSDALKGV